MELIQPLWTPPVHERGKTPLSPRSSLNIDSVVMETSPQPNTTSPSDAYWKIEVCENRNRAEGRDGGLTRTKTYPSFAARLQRSAQPALPMLTATSSCGRGRSSGDHIKTPTSHAIYSPVCAHWMSSCHKRKKRKNRPRKTIHDVQNED